MIDSQWIHIGANPIFRQRNPFYVLQIGLWLLNIKIWYLIGYKKLFFIFLFFLFYLATPLENKPLITFLRSQPDQTVSLKLPAHCFSHHFKVLFCLRAQTANQLWELDVAASWLEEVCESLQVKLFAHPCEKNKNIPTTVVFPSC